MSDKEEPAVEPVESELADEVGRLLDRSDASGMALLGKGGLLTQVTRAVLERALVALNQFSLFFEDRLSVT